MVTEKLDPIGSIHTLIKKTSGMQRFRQKNQDRFKTLTDREIEVLALVGNGMDNHTIAEELGISWVAVQNYRSGIGVKLNISDPADYITFALAYDLIRV